MRMVAAALLLVGTAAAPVVAAGANEGVVRREVAGLRFLIPRDHIFGGTIPWLPAPEKDSFVFLLRPIGHGKSIPDHQFLVEALTAHCPGNASQMLRIACGSEHSDVGDAPPYEKVESDLGSWSSNLYSVRRTPGATADQRRQVAYCQRLEPNPAKPKPSTLCTTFWAYKGMILQFSFDEDESPAVPAMKQDAMRLLDSWEVH